MSCRGGNEISIFVIMYTYLRPDERHYQCKHFWPSQKSKDNVTNANPRWTVYSVPLFFKCWTDKDGTCRYARIGDCPNANASIAEVSSSWQLRPDWFVTGSYKSAGALTWIIVMFYLPREYWSLYGEKIEIYTRYKAVVTTGNHNICPAGRFTRARCEMLNGLGGVENDDIQMGKS